MKNPRILKRQKPTVDKFCQEVNGKVVRIYACSTRHRDVTVEYERAYPHTNGTTDYVTIQTKLELMPNGAIRATYHKEISRTTRKSSFYDEEQSKLDFGIRCFDNDLPVNTRVNHLYKTRADREAEKPNRVRKVKPKQLSLPLFGAAAQLQEVVAEDGDKRVYSVEELLEGRSEFYSLELGETIKLPDSIITLLKKYKCSITEWEQVAMFSQVVDSQGLLWFVESIPDMRKNPMLKNFQEPVIVSEPQKTTQTIVKQSIGI